MPAKVIASVFTKEQVIEHEKCLYPEEERMTVAEIDELFEKYFEGKRSIGIEGISDIDKVRLQKYRYMQEKLPFDQLE